MLTTHPIAAISDEAFGWYFSGLVDGEGSFNFSVDSSRPRHFNVSFKIAFRADDEPGLRAIRDRIGVGRLYRLHAHVPTRSGTWPRNPLVSWETRLLADLTGVIIPLFQRFPLLMKKARDFVVWKEAVSLLHEIKSRGVVRLPGNRGGFATRIGDDEHERLLALAEQLKSVRKYAIASDTTLSPNPVG